MQRQTEVRRLTPRQWYRESELAFWDVFDMDHFVPTLDGFTELAVDEADFAKENGVVLHRPELAVYLLDWWKKVTLVA